MARIGSRTLGGERQTGGMTGENMNPKPWRCKRDCRAQIREFWKEKKVRKWREEITNVLIGFLIL